MNIQEVLNSEHKKIHSKLEEINLEKTILEEKEKELEQIIENLKNLPFKNLKPIVSGSLCNNSKIELETDDDLKNFNYVKITDNIYRLPEIYLDFMFSVKLNGKHFKKLVVRKSDICPVLQTAVDLGYIFFKICNYDIYFDKYMKKHRNIISRVEKSILQSMVRCMESYKDATVMFTNDSYNVDLFKKHLLLM